MTSTKDKAREILDFWDLAHWGRKPIADSSFQYKTRETLILDIATALQDERNAAIREAEVAALDLIVALRFVKGKPTLRDLVKLVRRIRKLKGDAP